MKISTIVMGFTLGLGLTSSVLFVPMGHTENKSVQGSISQNPIDEGAELGYAGILNYGLQSTTISGEFTAMNQTKENAESAAPFDASTFVRPTDQELKSRLSRLEYKVTQKDGTEPPFSNALHDEKRAGLYVDIVSGEPLFSSSDKFDSGTGWPSFSRPITEGVVIERDDRSLFGVRTEIRSSAADSHLGHVFNDGPAPTGRRYCMNAAAMRFIPLEHMKESGYGAYVNRVSLSSKNG